MNTLQFSYGRVFFWASVYPSYTVRMQAMNDPRTVQEAFHAAATLSLTAK